MKQTPGALTAKTDIQKNPDPKIDQDFPGFPNGNASESIITPETTIEKKVAAVNITDGEKMEKKKGDKDEPASVGSGGAFNATEEVNDDE